MLNSDKPEKDGDEEWRSHVSKALNADTTSSSDLHVSSEQEVVISDEVVLTFKDVIRKFCGKVRRTHPLKLTWIFILIFFLAVGNAMQIIGLNFWLVQFPAGGTPGNFTTLAISSLLFGILFLVMFLIYLAVKRPSLRFLRYGRGWWILFLIGLMDAVNSSMAFYAASHTPEVLQALFTSLVPVYAAGFTKWLLKDPRSYCNRWVMSSFALIVTGIVLAAASQFSHSFVGNDKDTVWWCLIFFFSVPPTVLMNIWQSMYMLEFTYDPSFDQRSFLRDYLHASELTASREDEATTNPAQEEKSSMREIETNREQQTITDVYGPQSQNRNPIPPHQGEDTIVKIVMLAAETNIQFVIIMATLPMDALPWWGGSSSVSNAWDNFADGVQFVFTNDKSFAFCVVYTLGFFFTYVGSAYLNQYSVTLCSMIGQLSSPITALLLIIFPSWNVEKGYTPWYMSLLAVVFLSVGSLIYAVWEEITEEEKQEGERKYKEKLLSKRRVQIPH